jgi:uncharacterized iron-regulated membrane protein
MNLRKIIFWLHLTAGTFTGVVILVMSFTGVMLAFEPQIVEFAERNLRTVSPPGPDATKLDVEAIMTNVSHAFPATPPTGITVRSDPTASATISFGREGTVFVNPYTGEVIGRGSKTHQVMHKIEDWHRWLASRETGRPITGASNTAFLVLVSTGFYLWWPRNWTPGAFKTVSRFKPRLQGKARNWNWHNVIGFWCAPILLIVTLTGVIMSYQWANNLLYRLTGNEPPPPSQSQGGPAQRGISAPAQTDRQRSPEERSLTPRQPDHLNAFFERAEQQVPGWVAITLRFPQQPGAPLIANIQEVDSWHPNPRSQLTLNASNAEAVKWEPFAGQNMGRKLRSWVKPLHTGEAGGLMGQIIACVASAGGVMLAWTGLAMAWHRFFQHRPKPATVPTVAMRESPSETPSKTLSSLHSNPSNSKGA